MLYILVTQTLMQTFSCKIQSVNKTGFASVRRFTEKIKQIYSHSFGMKKWLYIEAPASMCVCRCRPILFVQDVCTHFHPSALNISEQTTVSFIVPELRNLHVHTNPLPAEHRPRLGVTCGRALRCDTVRSRFCAGC